MSSLQHDPASQADGHSEGPRLVMAELRTRHDDAFRSALDELTWSLIEAHAIRMGLPQPTRANMLVSSWTRYRLAAKKALAELDPSTKASALQEAIWKAADDADSDPLGREAIVATKAIETYEAECYRLGGQVVKR